MKSFNLKSARDRSEFDDPLWSGLGYWVGTIPLFVLGFIFLLLAFLIKRQLKKPQKKPLLDTLLENESTLEIKDNTQ